MDTKQRKNINEMTKRELTLELDDMRDEYDRLTIINDIIKIVNRIALISDLQKVKAFTEQIYKQEMEEEWLYSIYGMRDNIHDMADNLVVEDCREELLYYSHLMYGFLLDRVPEATEGLYAITDEMRKVLLKHITKDKAV